MIEINNGRKTNLTKRELQVLKLIVSGKSNTEISKVLSISNNTVKSHCKSIFGKLNVNKRVDAVIESIVKGIVWL